MRWDASNIITIISSVGVGGVLQILATWLKDRKKTSADADKTDAETTLSYLNTVIERLDAEAKRSVAEQERLKAELTVEREGNSALRKRVRELEDEIDAVRRSARDTQHKCDDLAIRLKELVDDVQEKE